MCNEIFFFTVGESEAWKVEIYLKIVKNMLDIQDEKLKNVNMDKFLNL